MALESVKLAQIANVIGRQSSESVIATPQVWILVDPRGKEFKVKILGKEGQEIVVASTKHTGKSKILTSLKNYRLIQRALVAAGIVKFFSRE